MWRSLRDEPSLLASLPLRRGGGRSRSRRRQRGKTSEASSFRALDPLQLLLLAALGVALVGQVAVLAAVAAEEALAAFLALVEVGEVLGVSPAVGLVLLRERLLELLLERGGGAAVPLPLRAPPPASLLLGLMASRPLHPPPSLGQTLV